MFGRHCRDVVLSAVLCPRQQTRPSGRRLLGVEIEIKLAWYLDT